MSLADKCIVVGCFVCGYYDKILILWRRESSLTTSGSMKMDSCRVLTEWFCRRILRFRTSAIHSKIVPTSTSSFFEGRSATHFPSLRSNVPSWPVYGVFISQLKRHSRAYSSNECFIRRASRLHVSFSGRDMSVNIWNSPSGSPLVDIGILLWSLPLPNVTWHSGTCSYAVQSSINQTFH